MKAPEQQQDQRHGVQDEARVGQGILSRLPPAGERLWTLNAVSVPPGVDESAVRRTLLEDFGIEIGAGLGPLAGRIWRVGLMGSGSTLANVLLLLGALHRVLKAAGHPLPASRQEVEDRAESVVR